ncbi:VIT domain-containing protein [Candidatus Zixiibacteriota bacterium]
MHMIKRRILTIALTFLFIAIVVPAASGQQVHIVPGPGHEHPNAIYLASANLSVEIRGGVAHSTLTQVFANPNDWQAEGVYLFPLPEGAAVTDFRLTMDGIPVRGEVLDREQARNIYLDIVRRIRDPALLEWINNRVFQARIFPFDPGGERTLTLSYAQILPREGDFHVFRYLTGQGRMAAPPGIIVRQEPGIIPLVDQQPGRAQRVLPDRRGSLQRRSTSFVVEGTIRDDRPIRSVYSPTHPLSVEHQNEGTLATFSTEGTLYSREGFSLYYSTGEENGIGVGMLSHRPPGEDGFFLMTITPGRIARRESLPRDVIFVLDTSGSMRGDRKLEQAIEALDFGLSTLGAHDRFALVIYNSSIRAWRDDLADSDRRTVAEAREFIKQLTAEGGTNIEGALAASLDFASESVEQNGNGSHLTYVVFLTDGLATVGETQPDALLKQAEEGLPGAVRLFTWGVGYDVNAFLLDRLATEHGGHSAYVEPMEDLEVKVSAFFSRVSTPVLADLEIEVVGADTWDLFPADLPDLFEGTEITVMGRYRGNGRAEVRLTGRLAGREQTVRHPVELPRRYSEAAFLGSMWAQRKVGFLLEQIRLHGESEELKDEVVRLGEEYGIVTPYTAYLVIEEHMRSIEEMEQMAVAAPSEAARRMIQRDVAATRMARESIQARTAADASLYGGRAGSQQQTGAGDISLSVAERELQTSSLINRADFLSVQRVGEKTFQLDQEKQIWRDQAIKSEVGLVEVEIGSREFMRLLDQHELLARYIAMGEQVEVLLGNQAYRLILPDDPV